MTDKRFDINAEGNAKVNAIGEVNAETVYLGETRSRRRPEKEITWLKAFEKEVEGRLATSLHNQILINLGKQAQPEQVHRLWDMEVKSGQITETIPPETEILEVFDRPEIASKLLILGKPGAGKTTTLLELARALVRRALDDPSEPMPFLLNLSSWKDPKQSIKDWSIAELTTKGIGSKLSKKWLEDQKFLPLFDGLDEVRSDLQPACVKAINELLSGEVQPRSIVVCSRREEYELYPEKLNLNGAIYLQELSNKQIESYLDQIHRFTLWLELAKDEKLLELIRQPLLLSITLIAYQDELTEQWQALQITEERIEFLLDAYVQRMSCRNALSQTYPGKEEPKPTQTQQWLIRLAKELRHESETEFLIEKMQPTSLVNVPQKWAYNLTLGLIFRLFFSPICGLFGLALGLVLGLDSEPRPYLLTEEIITGLYKGLIFGLFFALFFGLISSQEKIKPVEYFNLNWSWKRARRALIEILCMVLVLTLMNLVGLFPLESIEGSKEKVAGLFFIAILGLFGGLKLVVSEVEIKTVPNQAIRKSCETAICTSLLTIGIISALLIGISLPYQKSVTPLYDWSLIVLLELSIVLIFGLPIALKFGGRACIQHFALRLVLFCSNSIPWNYARFLNYATERMFLQRIGGRYRFIHKLLQDHFAQMED